MKKLKDRTEAEEQKAFVKYLEMRGLLFTAVANENTHSFMGRQVAMKIASRARSMGVKKGVPDILIFEPRGGWHGCAIELKRLSGGKIYAEQRKWVQLLQDRGYYAFIAWGKDQAIEQLEEYLKSEGQGET